MKSDSVTKHVLMDGRLHIYRRDNSRFWQCSTYLAGRNHRTTTKEEDLALAKEVARYWYMERCVEARRTRLGYVSPLPTDQLEPAHTGAFAPLPRRRRAAGPTFKDAAEKFMAEYRLHTQGQRSARYTQSHQWRIDKYLMPFFGEKAISEVNSALINAYREARVTGASKMPARSTLHHETVTLRLILKSAMRNGWIDRLPDLSSPYKSSGKVGHRAWFSPTEYRALYLATAARAKAPKKERWRGVCEDLHSYVLFMANTGLRPDEAARLEYRDVKVVTDQGTGEKILEIEVRGKRGVGFCKSMPTAVGAFLQHKRRHAPASEKERVFGKPPRELLNAVLEELDLKYDRDGNVRTAYSLRHTYICLRLMEGADIYQIAKNCRTSVEMIEKHYAVHLKNTLDAAAINVRKNKPGGKKPQ